MNSRVTYFDNFVMLRITSAAIITASAHTNYLIDLLKSDPLLKAGVKYNLASLEVNVYFSVFSVESV